MQPAPRQATSIPASASDTAVIKDDLISLMLHGRCKLHLSVCYPQASCVGILRCHGQEGPWRDLTISRMPRLTVRPLASEDFDGFIAYFTRASQADAERMGLAIDRVPSPTQLRSDLEAMIATPVDRLRSFVLAWCIDD